MTIRIIAVRRKRGTVAHAITEGSESPRETMCGRSADGAAVSAEPVSCRRCLVEIERLGWN